VLGDTARAVRFFGCAEAQREQASVIVYEPVRLGYERAVATALDALGTEEFQAMWSAGQSCTLPDAVSEALALTPRDSGGTS